MNQKAVKRFPLIRCANKDCNRTVLYTSSPKDKSLVSVGIADTAYTGITLLCPRCKTMLAIIVTPHLYNQQ